MILAGIASFGVFLGIAYAAYTGDGHLLAIALLVVSAVAVWLSRKD